MVNEEIRKQLAVTERTFEGSSGTIEDGLDVDDAELVQLRRACRLLEVGSHLLEQGYYTVVIESSFVAIERTIQFRLIHDGAMAPEEVISSLDLLHGLKPVESRHGIPSRTGRFRFQDACVPSVAC